MAPPDRSIRGQMDDGCVGSSGMDSSCSKREVLRLFGGDGEVVGGGGGVRGGGVCWAIGDDKWRQGDF